MSDTARKLTKELIAETLTAAKFSHGACDPGSCATQRLIGIIEHLREQAARLEAERAEIEALLAALNAPSHLSSMTQRFRATCDDIRAILARKGER